MWFFVYVSFGLIMIGLVFVVFVFGVVLIRDKYVGEIDFGVKFFVDGGVYGIMVVVWFVCVFGVWCDGFVKVKGGLENYVAREFTSSESNRNAREMWFIGIIVFWG